MSITGKEKEEMHFTVVFSVFFKCAESIPIKENTYVSSFS